VVFPGFRSLKAAATPKTTAITKTQIRQADGPDEVFCCGKAKLQHRRMMKMSYWYRRVFLLAIPLILSNLTEPLLSTVDTILSGHLPSPAVLGGVAVGGILFNSIYWTFGFLRMTTTGLVAQSHGA
jgi:Na+-driven multidrug efflux pump